MRTRSASKVAAPLPIPPSSATRTPKRCPDCGDRCHFDLDCDEAQSVVASWRSWVSTGRDGYLAMELGG